MLNVIPKIFSLLNSIEKRKLVFLTIVVTFVAFIEVAGIASIMPFMAVVGSPKIVKTNGYLFWAYKTLDFNSINAFLIFLGTCVFIILLLSNGLRALALWMELHFVHLRLFNISRRLFFSYLSQPYVYFLNINTSKLNKNILNEVSRFAHDFLRPCIQIFSRVVVLFFIITLLLFVNPFLTLSIFFVLGGIYGILFILVQKKQKNLGIERFTSNTERFKSTTDAFGGIKDLKILNREKHFFDYFSHYALKCEKSLIAGGLIEALPSYIMEALSFGGIMMIILYFLTLNKDVDKLLPTITVFAFAGSRMMPALQGVYRALNTIRYNLIILDTLHSDLSNVPKISIDWPKQRYSQISFKKNIQLSSISFTYEGTNKPTIKGLDLSIEKNTSVGLVGTTGSGKTTIIDIVLGLLKPERGCLKIDDVEITNENLVSWQRKIGYVPQSIFLSDDSLASNIAFGIPKEKINMMAVKRSVKMANLENFVENELADRYETYIGERGVRLSGGQRQRIGIARALYHDPDVLIMDEATSALDGVTEATIMQAIRDLSGKKTIITIAHRLTTLRDCGIIYIIDKGCVIEKGNYLELSKSSSLFKAMSQNLASDLHLR